MRILLDTNMFLEILLGQEKAYTVKRLLAMDRGDRFYVSDFSMHSIGVILFRAKLKDTFTRFVADIVGGAGIEVLSLAFAEVEHVAEYSERFNLDFDDAYQYAIAEKHDLIIASFDSDFDRTVRSRKTPAQLM